MREFVAAHHKKFSSNFWKVFNCSHVPFNAHVPSKVTFETVYESVRSYLESFNLIIPWRFDVCLRRTDEHKWQIAAVATNEWL